MTETEPIEPKLLCGTPLSIDWLESVVRKELNVTEKVKLSEWSAEKMGIGQGFLSHIMKVKLNWAPEGTGAPTVLVLKMPTIENVNRELDKFEGPKEDMENMKKGFEEGFLPLAHRSECQIYDIFRNNPIPGVPMPKTYYTRPMSLEAPGVIVMEDLSIGSHTVNIVDCLRLDQVLTVAEHLAHLQAYAVKNPGLWDGLEAFSEDIFRDFDNSNESTMKKLEEMKPEYFKGKTEAVKKMMGADQIKGSLNCRAVQHSHEKLGIPAVLCHGDLWTNNILFAKDESQKNGASAKVVAIIDCVPVAHMGNCAEDLARMMIMGCDTVTRRTKADEIFAHFHRVLSDDLDGKPPYTLDNLKKAYKEVAAFAMSCFLFPLPMLVQMPMMEGPDKEERIESMFARGRDILEDITAMCL